MSTLIEKVFSSIRESVKPPRSPYFPYGVAHADSVATIKTAASLRKWWLDAGSEIKEFINIAPFHQYSSNQLLQETRRIAGSGQHDPIRWEDQGN